MYDATDPPTEAPPLQLETLSGDIRDAMLTHFQNQKKPWPQMSGEEQRMVVNSFTEGANKLVREVVQLFTNYEFKRAVVTLGEVKVPSRQQNRSYSIRGR